MIRLIMLKEKIYSVGFVLLILAGSGKAQDAAPVQVQVGQYLLKVSRSMKMTLLKSDTSSTQFRTLCSFETPTVTLEGGNGIDVNRSVTDWKVVAQSAASTSASCRAIGQIGELGVKTEISLFSEPGRNPLLFVKMWLYNRTSRAITIRSMGIASLHLDARAYGGKTSFSFWTFQGGTYPERPDWIFPLTSGFHRDNFQGMNAPDYGGGMPIVDLWTKRGGIALASLATEPKPISLPVRVDENGSVSVGLVDSTSFTLSPDDSAAVVPFVVILHEGDYFNALQTYASTMRANGFVPAPTPTSSYEPEWCAWGYGRDFKVDQILATLPKVKELGFGWVTIDDGWQSANGDWKPWRKKFPRSDPEFRELVDSIHAAGLKARLWWVPLEAHDLTYSEKHFPMRKNEFGMQIQSEVGALHPEWFQLNANGSRTQVSWWNSYMLCPAVKEVREYYVAVTTRMLHDWKFDGFKIDGQNLNSVPPCYNPLHHHRSPEDAPKAVPEFFRELYHAAVIVRPDVVLYVCPCGTNCSMYILPFFNQPVASDPKTSWQVRHRGKTYKALLGSNVPFNGDHVELTNRQWSDEQQRFAVVGEEDFASTVGIGGVISSKFTMPDVSQSDSSLMLTKTKERRWKSWLDVYRRESLGEGTYMNLYDIAFDVPETHAIKKGDTLYYAFYYDSGFSGPVELRGLQARRYEIVDYVNEKSLGIVDAGIPKMKFNVNRWLLIKAIPLREKN